MEIYIFLAHFLLKIKTGILDEHILSLVSRNTILITLYVHKRWKTKSDSRSNEGLNFVFRVS